MVLVKAKYGAQKSTDMGHIWAKYSLVSWSNKAGAAAEEMEAIGLFAAVCVWACVSVCFQASTVSLYLCAISYH